MKIWVTERDRYIGVSLIQTLLHKGHSMKVQKVPGW